jgi:hypothetical protein
MVGKRPSSCRRIFLSLKIGDLDIDGTMKIVKEVYNILTGFGTPSYLLCNRYPGSACPTQFLRVPREKLRFRNKKKQLT